MNTPKQKKNAARAATSDLHELKMIQRKLEGITPADIETVRRKFEHKLHKDGSTRIDWLRSRGMESDEPTVSKVLHGKATSQRILSAVVDYLIETN